MGIFLSKASTAASSRPNQPNWARVYSTTLGVRGGAASTAETVGSEAAPGSVAAHPASTPAVNDPFRHLPGVEVGVLDSTSRERVCISLQRLKLSYTPYICT